MDTEEIRAKIAHKQALINLEKKDQNKKNELLQDLNVLQMRLDMEQTHDTIKKMTKRD